MLIFQKIALTKQNTSISGAAIESFKKQRGTKWVEISSDVSIFINLCLEEIPFIELWAETHVTIPKIALTKQNTSISGAAIESFKKQVHIGLQSFRFLTQYGLALKEGFFI